VVRPIALVVAAALAACFGPDSHRCTSSTDCGDGVCEANGYCSFASDDCRRYGAGAGDLAGQCVVDAAVIDGAADDAAVIDAAGPDGSDVLIDARAVDAAVIDARPADAATTDARPADAATTDASPVDAPPNDRDADGVLDATDNCPDRPNRDQADEDGDADGDVCDNCPHLSNADQRNGDGDDLGDACDPTPATAGSRLLSFDAFIGTSLGVPPGWTVGSGPWSTLLGALTVRATTDAVTWRSVPSAPGRTIYVQAATTFMNATTPAHAGLLAPIDYPAGSGEGCGVRVDVGPGTTVNLARLTLSGTTIAAMNLSALPWPLTALRELGLQRRTSMSCVAVGSSTTTSPAMSAASHNDRVGLVARNGDLQVAWLVVFTD
jgi:hypothetical protein